MWGEAPPDSEPVQRVAVGGDRGRRGRTVALAALALLIVGGLLLGGGDDATSGRPQDGDGPTTTARASTTTRPRTATTSTSTTVVLGPILPEKTGAAVLLYSESTGRWAWVELDTGLVRPVEVPSDDAYSAVPVRGGVVVQREGDAVFVPLPEGEEVVLGTAEQLVSAGLPDAVWFVQLGMGAGPPGTADSTARLVGLDGSVRATVGTPQLFYATGATRDGLVFTSGGRTYLARAEGIEQLGVGDVLAVADPFVVILTCDEQAVCGPEVLDTRTGRRRALEGASSRHQYGISVTVSPAGEVAVAQRDQERGLTVYDASGRIVGTAAGYLADVPLRWLPGGAGLVGAGRPLSLIGSDGAGGLVSRFVTGVDFSADVVFVIPG